jgi:hypothetical protein
VSRLTVADVGCWVIKTSVPPPDLAPGWRPGSVQRLSRCLRSSYRLGLMAPGQPCLLWLSGPRRPGVHAVGTLAGPPDLDGPGGPAVEVGLTLLPEPAGRADLLADPATRDAEVLRMPAGSNPSWLSPAAFQAVRARVTADGRAAATLLGPWAA